MFRLRGSGQGRESGKTGVPIDGSHVISQDMLRRGVGPGPHGSGQSRAPRGMRSRSGAPRRLGPIGRNCGSTFSRQSRGSGWRSGRETRSSSRLRRLPSEAGMPSHPLRPPERLRRMPPPKNRLRSRSVNRTPPVGRHLLDDRSHYRLGWIVENLPVDNLRCHAIVVTPL